jgi:hypothetical protein
VYSHLKNAQLTTQIPFDEPFKKIPACMVRRLLKHLSVLNSNQKNMNILKTLALLGAVIATGATVVATPITGGITFEGNLVTDNADFLLATKFTAFNNVQTQGTGTGDYTGIPDNVPATYNPFTFTGPGTLSELNPPSLWTFTYLGVNYSFDLISVAIGSRDASGIHLIGSGVAHIDGFDATEGSWDLAAGSANQFHFSAGNDVPDGGATAILMGVGLLGVGALRRKNS